MHATKWAQIGVKLVQFGGKSGVDDAGSLLGSFPNIKKIRQNFTFSTPIHTPTLPPTLVVWSFLGRKLGCISCQSTPQRLGLLPKTLFIKGFNPKILLTPCENSMLTSHLTLKRIFEKNAVFWAWYGQNTAKFPTACLKMGSKMGEIGRIWVRKVA